MSETDSPVVMLASGTRGDVQPYLALGLGLQQAGIPVVIAAAPRFRACVEAREVGFADLEGNPSDLMGTESGATAATLRGGAARGVAATIRFLREAQAEYRRMLESAAAACRPARAIIVGLSSIWGFSIAEALGVPCVPCFLQPFGRTRTFPSALLPVRASLGHGYNSVSYRAVEQAMWLPWRRTINAWRRRTLGLSPLPLGGPWRELHESELPWLYGFSPTVLPPPHDWPPARVATGYWFLDDGPDGAPQAGLERFLSKGDPPLYIGFGSMGMDNGGRDLRIIDRALEASGLRAVISPGVQHTCRRIAEGSPRMFSVEGVSHAWLFPRVAAVMHHGGAGTTAAGLRAGVPSIIFPVAADQHFWGERIARLGVGPRPLTRRMFTTDRLSGVLLHAATDRRMKERAERIGRCVRAETGVARAVAALLPLLG